MRHGTKKESEFFDSGVFAQNDPDGHWMKIICNKNSKIF